MWIRSSGSVSENVFQLTTPVSNHAYIIGHASALVDASIAAVSERLIISAQEVIGQEDTLDFILLTHADYDTVGGVHAIRARYPECELICCAKTSEILADKNILKEYYDKNKELAETMNVDFSTSFEDWSAAIDVTRVLGDGDGIDLGEDVQLKLVASPGYRDDAVNYYVQPDNILACCESVGGYGGRESVMNCFTSDYSEYLSSIQRLSALEVKAILFPHHGTITGEMVTKYFMDVQGQALQFRKSVSDKVSQGELIEEIVAGMLADWQTTGVAPKGPFANEQEQALTDMVRAIAKLGQ